MEGLTPEQIGTTAWQANLPVYELTAQQASLEEAFMQLTHDAVRVPQRRTTPAGPDLRPTTDPTTVSWR